MKNYQQTDVLRISSTKKVIFMLLFIVSYLMNAQFRLPYNALLRWFMLVLFLMYYIYINDFKIKISILKNCGWIWFGIMVFPNLITVCRNGYTLARTLSFLIVLLAFGMFHNTEIYTKERGKIYFDWFSNILIVGSLLSVPFMALPAGYFGGRFRGIMTNANGCALITVFALICAVYKMKTTRHKLVFFVTCILFFIEILLTQSRMAFAGAAVVFILLPFLLGKKNNAMHTLLNIGFIVIMFVAGYYLLLQLNPRVLERFANDDMSRKAWEYAYQRIELHPVFGVGYSTSSYQQSLNPLDRSWSFFSSYLELLVDCGYYGFLCTVIYFVFKLLPCIKNALKDDFILFLLLFVGVGLMIGVSESYIFAVGNPISLCFWFVFSLLVHYNGQCEVLNCEQ